jgi:hypothetical protein
MAIRKVVTYITSDGKKFDKEESAERYEEIKRSTKEIEVVVVQTLHQQTYRSIEDSEDLESFKEKLIKEYESKCIDRGDISYWGIPGPPKVVSVTIDDKMAVQDSALKEVYEYIERYNKADNKLQHSKHKYAGYQGFVKGECNPFSLDSARAKSWEEGWYEAQQDFEYYHPKGFE